MGRTGEKENPGQEGGKAQTAGSAIKNTSSGGFGVRHPAGGEPERKDSAEQCGSLAWLEGASAEAGVSGALRMDDLVSGGEKVTVWSQETEWP